MNRSSLLAVAGVVAFAVAVYAVALPPWRRAEPAAPQRTPDARAGGKVPHDMREVQLTFAPVVKRVAPAVVNVYSRSVVQAPAMNPFFNDPFFQRFFGVNPQMRQRVQQSLGSGVIVRADGLILTNNHVIQGGQDIVVALSDKREFKAKVHAGRSAHRSGRAEDRHQGREAADRRIRQQRHAAGRRSGARHRRSVRRRPDRDHGHRLGAWRAPMSAPRTISSSSRPMPRSIRAIRAARW